jgi:hypothetical protein
LVSTLTAALLNSSFRLGAGATIDGRDAPTGIDPTEVLPKRWGRLRRWLTIVHPDAGSFLPTGRGGRRPDSSARRLEQHRNYLVVDSELIRGAIQNKALVRLWENDRKS